nr:hypothetical protein [Tanacetum cinerariifolium]
MEESLNKFMVESAKRHDGHSSLNKEIRALRDAAIKNQGALIKALKIQIGEDDKMSLIELNQTTIPFPGHLKGNGYDEKEVLKKLKKPQVNSIEFATSLRRLLKEKSGIKEETKAKMHVHCSAILKVALPSKEKVPRSFTLPCKNMDAYRDKDIGDVIVQNPFCRVVGVEAKRNRPLLQVNARDILEENSHSYQKLKGFFKRILNLGLEYIRNGKMVEWLTCGHVPVISAMLPSVSKVFLVELVPLLAVSVVCSLLPAYTVLVVPVFQKGDDLVDAINHMMSFLTAIVTSRVIIQSIQGRQNSLTASTSRPYTSGPSGNNLGKQRIVLGYNCKGEGHMSKQCTKPNRKMDEAWFKDKVLLVQAQANGQVLHEEELEFLANPGIAEDQSTQPTIVEVPKELPKVSMVNSSLKKLKFHLASFDVVVKERTTATAITEGTWGFEHIEACFINEIIPFVKALKDLFNSFDQFLLDELTKVQNVFNQIE